MTLDVSRLDLRRLVCLAAAALVAAVAILAIQIRPAAAFSTATGDPRNVSQPSIPATCTALTSTLADPSSRTFSTAQETTPPDTSRIQSALNSCAGSGHAVELKASGSNNAFLSGPLTVGSSVTLLIDAGVTLVASRNPKNYQVSGGPTCGTIQTNDGGCAALITITGSNSGVMGTSSGGHQGLIDGRGDLDILGTSTTWWALATTAKSGGKQNNPRLIQSNNANNVTIFDLSLTKGPNFHIVMSGGSGFTAWGVRILTPATARNTDGIDPSGSDVTIANSFIEDGDDGIAIKASSHASSNMTIKNNFFYGTHGISIGSETNAGDSNILFENNTLNGKDSSGNTSGDDNGIRIKSDSSKGGLVTTVTYVATCTTAIKHALEFNPFQSSSTGSLDPNFQNIVVNGLKSTSSVSSASSLLEGFSSSLPLGLTLENVQLDATSVTAKDANIALFNTNLKPSGTGVTVTSFTGSGSVPSCSFPAFPGL
jgi:polygalacturonase